MNHLCETCGKATHCEAVVTPSRSVNVKLAVYECDSYLPLVTPDLRALSEAFGKWLDGSCHSHGYHCETCFAQSFCMKLLDIGDELRNAVVRRDGEC